MKRVLIVLALAMALALPAIASAAGGHDSLECSGCHSIHDAQGPIIFAVAPNNKALDPATKQPYKGVTALCLGCHEVTGGMGIKPIEGKKSHPYSVTPDPKVAGVPAELLRDGKLECIGCHDPHPSNPNHKYLRVDTKGGSNMSNFCSLCHSSKSGKKVSSAQFFNSMDQRNVK